MSGKTLMLVPCQLATVIPILAGLTVAKESAEVRGEFTLAAGSYEVEISATYAYTIRKIIFEGEALGRPTGFYGTIFAPAPGKFIGAGHKEGGLEKVESVKLQVDRKNVIPEAGRRYEGKSILYSKTSMLDNLRVDMKLQLSPEGIVMYKTYQALEDQKARSLYLYQFCWSSDTKEWIAELATGEMKEGEFLDDNGWRLQEDVKWTAIYDPAIRKGMLMYYPTVIPGNLRKSAYWDIPGRYHKYYLMADIPPVIAKGRKSGPHAIVLKGISADARKWKEQAKRIAEKLRDHPPENDQ